MTITRDGKRIDLTPAEMRNAYNEMQTQYRKEDVESIVAQLNSNVEVDIEYAVDVLEDIISKNDGYWACYWDCVNRAINIAKGD